MQNYNRKSKIQKKSKNGKLIVIDGIDGSGKSTQAKLLLRKLKQQGCTVILTKEPNSPLIKKLIAANKDSLTDLFLFLADRSLHYQKIQQWLREGYIVISDRSFPSTWCYQYYPNLAKIISEDFLDCLDHLSRHSVQPDLVIILDAPLSVLKNRIKFKDKFEKLKFLQTVQKAYHYYSKKFGWKVIDTQGSSQNVAKEIVHNLKHILDSFK